MIGSLNGKLLDRNTSGAVTVDVNGVGYDVIVTGPTVASLGDIGSEAFLHVHTRVREDAITLYGFGSRDEKRCFDALIGAHGVGPTVALALLTAHSPASLRQIISRDESETLARVPGIGKKTAARLLIELKSRFEIDLDATDSDLSALLSPASGALGSARSDVVSALTGLGYGSEEIRAVVSTLPDEGVPEELLRLALQSLAKANIS